MERGRRRPLGRRLTLLGYFLGKSFPGLQDNLEIAILLIVGVSVLPMIFEYLKHRRAANAIAQELGEAAEESSTGERHPPRRPGAVTVATARYRRDPVPFGRMPLGRLLRKASRTLQASTLDWQGWRRP